MNKTMVAAALAAGVIFGPEKIHSTLKTIALYLNTLAHNYLRIGG